MKPQHTIIYRSPLRMVNAQVRWLRAELRGLVDKPRTQKVIRQFREIKGRLLQLERDLKRLRNQQ